jgi:hypothetical protein
MWNVDSAISVAGLLLDLCQIGLTRLSRTRDLLGVTGSRFMRKRVFDAMPNARQFFGEREL